MFPENVEGAVQIDPRLISVDTDNVVERLVSGRLSFDEALVFYNRCVATGASFPIQWEAKILEIGVVEYPDRNDMRERLHLIRSMMEQAAYESAVSARPLFGGEKLSGGERVQIAKLLAGSLSTPQAHSLFAAIGARGIVIQSDWEEALLRQCIAEDPSRTDLTRRLRHIVVESGRHLDPEMEQKFRSAARENEYDTDHQAAARAYDRKTGYDDLESSFLDLIGAIKPFTMTSVERMYALYKSVRFIVEADIEGAIVECGVWRGGSMMLVAKTLLALGVTDRKLYLFDTFEGLPRPDEAKDVDIWGNRAIDGWLPMQVDIGRSLWANAGIEEVIDNLTSTGYPRESMHFVKGLVETTIPAQSPGSIALLRLDTDWYASTKHELTHLYPSLSRNGVLIIDDYGHFEGARIAVDEYLAELKVPLLLNRVDYSGRLGVKI